MTALEERISGLLTAFLNMDAQHSLKSTSAVLVAGQNIVFILFFFASIPFMQNFIKAPFYCETKFGMECVPTQQEKSYSSM